MRVCPAKQTVSNWIAGCKRRGVNPSKQAVQKYRKWAKFQERIHNQIRGYSK